MTGTTICAHWLHVIGYRQSKTSHGELFIRRQIIHEEIVREALMEG